MSERGELSLDQLFEVLERITPEGFRAEIVEGAFFMTPQRTTHWEVIRRVLRQLEDRFGEDTKILSDVRIDFPGYKNAFCPDLAKLADEAVPNEKGRWSCQDVEFVLEVISRGTDANDYGKKKDAYAAAGVPVYLIVDPYAQQCHVFTEPKDDEYRNKRTRDFGEPIDLTDTVIDVTLSTKRFPRD
ncbi:Uma2 family endonuclease [Streptomyces sp. P1-3]|uniref:Uma2 family endonuclease n=1 Tax=Streptomyces sp. P1-3 TaxID=3421658 RepID=UPI003D35C578